MGRTKGLQGRSDKQRDRGNHKTMAPRLVECCRLCGTELEKGQSRCYVAGYLLCQDCLDMAINYLEGQIRKAKEVKKNANN